MPRVFIGLGSNLGDRDQNLRRALEELASNGIPPIKVSSFYETDPVGPLQPDFINAACIIETELQPEELVAKLKAIEVHLGRSDSAGRWGPRVIDLDLLLYGDQSFESEAVTVPHKELTSRAFAMAPVLEIDPDVELPSGEPLSAFCEKNPKGVRRL